MSITQFARGVSAAALLLLAGPALAQSGPPVIGRWGFDPATMDRSVQPGNDWNRYTSGAWLDATVIPADRTSWSASSGVFDQVEGQLHAIVDESVANPTASVRAARIGALYASFMDEATVNRLGAQPLTADLAAVRAAETHEALARLMAQSESGFGISLFDVSVFEDPHHPATNTAFVDHSGLGLPDRDYYLSDGFAEVRTRYQAHIARMLTLAGWAEPERHAAEVMAFETAVARLHWPIADQRDVQRTDNPRTPGQLAEQAPGFPWAAWLDGLGLQPRQVIANELAAFAPLGRLYADTPVETLQAWQAFHTADNAAPYLSDDFAQAWFDFHGKVLGGTPENRVRWKRGVTAVNDYLGEALGQEYVERNFPASSKAQVQALVANLIAAMRERLQHLDWMSAETRRQALYKIDHFSVKVGYPDRWRDYTALTLRADDLYGNIRRARAFAWDYSRNQVDHPIDPLEWGITPQTIDAYYNPSRNEIVFPAAILQAPFFDPNADTAINYGGIGTVIGHEITHGFDDQGRQVDGDGLLRDWWTPADVQTFNARAARFGAQYAAEEPVAGHHINPGLTMGENIADMGGMLIALDAYHLALHGNPAPVIDGLTGDQRFFLGNAQVWRQKIRDAALIQRLASNPHSPHQWRSIMPLRNIDAWYAAFGVLPGQARYLPPEQRVRIW